ncbi:hypothetical protein [Nostoc sp. CMAA1605]|nr:hypothetical protein [Nostoc sp. CMAA1605]
MGTGDWGIGRQGRQGRQGRFIFQCPMPHAPCPMPHSRIKPQFG